jgi:phosphoribosylanthranilate isomerase
MKLIGEDEEELQKLASDFAEWGKDRPKGVSPPERMAATVVLDSGDLRQPGGTGKTFDWKMAVPIAEGMRQSGVKLVVAGGLTPENVGEAIEILKPWGVDVVSGVESTPGKKDPKKVRAFVRAVREIDRKTS